VVSVIVPDCIHSFDYRSLINSIYTADCTFWNCCFLFRTVFGHSCAFTVFFLAFDLSIFDQLIVTKIL